MDQPQSLEGGKAAGKEEKKLIRKQSVGSIMKQKIN
jgi:hypothetical protein